MSELLFAYDAEFPGFVDLFQRLLTEYFGIGPRTHPVVAGRMEECLRGLGPESTRKALGELSRAGLFTGETMREDSQVSALWTSPLMGLCRAAIGGSPGPDDDLVGSYPPPVADMHEHALRQAAFRNTRITDIEDGVEKLYWRESLKLAAPELYLLPFLKDRGDVRGLDLGCGWGRGSLGLRDYASLQVVGVDIGEDELTALRAQARRAGLEDRVTAVNADVTSLPFPSDSFDFALSYLVLDLLSCDALGRALDEVLRCLKVDSPFYVDMPIDFFAGSMQLQKQTGRGWFVELLHGRRAHGKIFQLAFYDLRVARQSTFAVLAEDALDSSPGRAKASWRVNAAAARLRGEPLPPPPSRQDLRQRIARIRRPHR